MSNSILIRNRALSSEQIADMDAEMFHTYAVIASLADENGQCTLPQQTLASYMGVTRETANRRIQRLLTYRWRGEPLIVKDKIDYVNVYTLLT